MMTKRTKLGLRAAMHGAWLLGLAGCNSNDNLVGVDGCYGEHTVCDSKIDSFTVEGDGTSVIAFDVAPSRTLVPTWTQDLPCKESCFAGAIEPAPDAGVWTLVQGDGHTQLVRIGPVGEQVRAYDVKYGQQLSVTEDKWPVLSVGLPTSGGAQRVAPDGELESIPLPPTPHFDGFFLAGPDGSVRAQAIGSEDSAIYEFDAEGTLIWKQDNLHDVPIEAYTVQNQVASRTAAVSLADGGLAFLVPKRTGDGGPAGISGDFLGITRLDRDGNARWETYLTRGAAPYYLDEWKDSGIVVTSASDPDYLLVSALREDGSIAAAWLGRRQSFFSMRPLATCVDANADIYLALLVGERDAPGLAICRITGTQPMAAVDCAGIEAPDLFPPINGFGLIQSVVDMTSPEPGAVVISLSHTENNRSRARLLRADF